MGVILYNLGVIASLAAPQILRIYEV